MESLVIRAKEVLETLRKNDENIEKLLEDVNSIKEKAVKFRMARNSLEKIDDTSRLYHMENNLDGKLGESSYKYGHIEDNNEILLSDTENNNELKKQNQMLKKEIESLKGSNKSLIQENEQLSSLLSEHVNVLQHVMEKYRSHVMELLSKNDTRIAKEAQIVIENLQQKLSEKDDQIAEMADIMRTAIKLDANTAKNELEWISQLFTENKLYRDLLDVKRTASTNELWDELYMMKKKTELELLKEENETLDSNSNNVCLSQPHSDCSISDNSLIFYSPGWLALNYFVIYYKKMNKIA